MSSTYNLDMKNTKFLPANDDKFSIDGAHFDVRIMISEGAPEIHDTVRILVGALESFKSNYITRIQLVTTFRTIANQATRVADYFETAQD